MSTHISYGKLAVPVQLVRGERLLACEVGLEVLGQGFLAAYTEGDNTGVVATDTMKNVILRRAHEYEGETFDGLLELLGRGFLGTYPEMEGVRLTARELPFVAVSDTLFRRVDAERAVAELELDQDGVVARGGAVEGLRLLKTTGSAFTRFARDADTTLPERVDRPLFIHLDVSWSASAPVAPAAVRDLVLATFDELVSESIQQLVHVMGTRLLDALPELTRVAFRAENHTHDPVPGAEDAAPLRRTYTAPFPAWGLITLVLER